MKRHLQKLEQRLRELIVEPLQRSGGGRTEPLDVWSEVQKHLRNQITLNIAGVPMLPARHVIVRLAVPDQGERQRLESALDPALLRDAIQEFLSEEGCRPPVGLWVSLDFLPAEFGAITSISVAFDNQPAPGGAAGTSAGAESGCTLRVKAGQASAAEVRLTAHRINLGRRERVTDDTGRVVRNNHLAFTDVRNGINETVSRRHAHLEFDDKAGCYRIFRDSADAPVTVVSQGRLTSEIPLSGLGLALRPGDVIRLGKAEVEFGSVPGAASQTPE